MAVPGTGIAADKPNPQPLWNAYPLDGDQGSSSGGASQNAATTTTAPQPAAPAASANTQPVTVTESAGDAPPWLLMILAAAVGALLVVALLALQGRRSRRRQEALVGVADEWPWLGTGHANGTGEVRAAQLRAANGAATDLGSEQNRGAERAVQPASNGTASEWVADRDRGVESEREMGVAPAEGAAAERVAEPQPVAEGEPAANGVAAGWEPVADAAAGRSAEPPVDEAADEWVAEGEPEPVVEAESELVVEVEPEPVAEVEPEPVVEAEPELVAEAEPEPVVEPEPEPVAEASMNGTAAERAEPGLGVPATGAVEHGAERVVDAAATGAAAEHAPEDEPEREVAANGAAPADDAHESREPGFDVVEAAAVPRQRFDRVPANGKPAASRRGPICQVRWSAGAKCLFAVATDANGVEHRIAWSPPIEWGETGPPDEDSREARAALRVLTKDLRDKGWRPMRAKGDDFDEARWYARRFRFPIVEGDDDPAPWRYGPPQLAEREA